MATYTAPLGVTNRLAGQRFYELSNHLGNVLSTVSDNKLLAYQGTSLPKYKAEIISYSDYYPFGWEMPGRKYNSAEYRYGFNGKEKDDEGEFGSITNYDYGFRIYNPAVGRFLSVDPLASSYAMLTPYQYASNTPIQAIDVDGKEGLLGAIIGGGLEFIGQFSVAIASGKTPKEAVAGIDYFDVAVSAGQSFLSPTGTIQAIHKTTTKILIKGAKELGVEILKASVDLSNDKLDFIGQEGSDKTFGGVISQALVNFTVNKGMEHTLDPFSQFISKKAKVNLASANNELVTRSKIAEKFKKSGKSVAKRIEQKIRRVEKAMKAVDNAKGVVDRLESITPVTEVFSEGLKTIAKPVIAEPIGDRIDEVKSSVDRVITFSGDRNSVTVEQGGKSRTFIRSADSGDYELQNK